MMDRDDPPTAAELRRYLRHASVLLASAERPVGVDQHEHALRLARHWMRTALAGVERLHEIVASVPVAIEEPLTGPIEHVTMQVRR